jgi:hypothetical protein
LPLFYNDLHSALINFIAIINEGMQKYFILLFWFPYSLGVKAQERKLDGAYEIVKASYGNGSHDQGNRKVIKLFQNGYWIAAFFGDPNKPYYLDGTGGCTYSTEKTHYIETLNFFSWDSTAVGKTITFNYKFEGNLYYQKGVLNSDQYKNDTLEETYKKIIPHELLQNSSLEGAWKMEEGDWWDGKLGKGDYSGVSVIKIFAYPRFAFAYYDLKKKIFVGAGGGSYQFNGKTLTENIEYWSWGKPDYPISIFSIKINGDSYRQSGWEGKLYEQYKKLK